MKEIDKVLKFINENPKHHPILLKTISEQQSEYRAWCEKQNNTLLREAIGDAVHLLGMTKKPPVMEIKNYCTRIVKAIFPKGITDYHHEGERNFYNKYIETKGE